MENMVRGTKRTAKELLHSTRYSEKGGGGKLRRQAMKYFVGRKDQLRSLTMEKRKKMSEMTEVTSGKFRTRVVNLTEIGCWKGKKESTKKRKRCKTQRLLCKKYHSICFTVLQLSFYKPLFC